MENILSTIENCIGKGAIIDFRNYLATLDGCKKWMIHSDYCIGAKNKPNDVAVFSILPHLTTYEDQVNYISKNIPNDIKETRKIKGSIIKTINSGLFFHFCFVMDKRKYLFKTDESENEKENIISAIKESQQIINSWKKSTKVAVYYESIDIRISSLLKEMEQKSFNVTLFKDIALISLLSAYITHLLTNKAGAEIVGWFSDRDKITSSYKSIIFDLFHLNHHGLSLRDSVDTNKFKIIIGVPDGNSAENMWYDIQNRIPDHIAGTLADYNLVKNTVSKEKFIDMLSKSLSRESLFAIIKCSFGINGFECSRLIFNAEEKL